MIALRDTSYAKRLYHRKRGLWLRMNYDELSSICDSTQRSSDTNVLEYEEGVSIYENKKSLLVFR